MLHQPLLDVEVVLRGGGSLKEHPGYPREPGHASVWCTDIRKQVRMHVADSFELHVQQWRYWAASPKPPVLRTMGIPHKGAMLRACELAGAI